MSAFNWSGRQVLVTGAGGFIGSHLAERLAALGARTRAFVHYRATGSWGWLDQSPHKDELEVIAGDVRDRDSVSAVMSEVDVVFHLAALIGIPYSYEAPESYLDTNVKGTLNVLQAARAAGVSRVIQTSTSEVYGTAQTVPISETHPLEAQSPYAASKTGADQLAMSFHRSFQLPVTIVRPFNTFGPRQSARAVIPTIISQCLAGGPVKLGNLAPTRDMNFVANTVEGFIRAAEVPAAAGRTINLGSGREISVGDLARLIAELCDRPLELEVETPRVRPGGSEVERLVADATLARTLLGFTPSVTLEQGLALTIAWMREHQDDYRPSVYSV